MRAVVMMPGPNENVLWVDPIYGTMCWSSWAELSAWVPDYGSATVLGGEFRSPPAAVAIGDNRLEVFGLGPDYALYHKSITYEPGGESWAPDWENLGGDLTSTPVVASTTPDRLDIFVLGPDQGMLHRSQTGTIWSEWNELGGCFTSPPVVLPSGLDTFDIFARGPDYMIYQSTLAAASHSGWAAVGGSLLREPIAASAPAAVRVHDELYVFVVAADMAIWFTRYDGILWKPWSSLGGAFVSEPVVIALFPEIDQTGTGARRIDVFGVRSPDHVLVHNWLEQGSYPPGQESQGWHGWKSTNDAEETPYYMSAPGISAPNPAATPFEMPPAIFSIVQPAGDGTIHTWLLREDGTSTVNEVGPLYLLPSTFAFAIDSLDIISIRSPESDTDYGAATVLAGAQVPLTKSSYLGDWGTGQFVVDPPLALAPFTLELCEPVAISWSIANSGNSDTAHFVGTILAKASEDIANDYLKRDTGLLKGVLALGITGISPLGSLAGAVFAVLLDYGLAYIFQDCDGIVAVGAVSYPNGKALQKAVLQSPEGPQGELRRTTETIGEDPGGHCNAPHYKVNWLISTSPLDPT